MKYSELLKLKKEFESNLDSKVYSITIFSNIIVHQLKELLEFPLRSESINAKVKFLQFVAAINQYETNTYISTGFEFKYRRWSFIYGILSQEYKSLGTPQSFQLVWHY